MIFTPRLGVPWRFADLVEVYPEVGWHQTLYGTEEKDFDERHLFTGRLDLRTRVRGELGDFATHILEPRVGYARVDLAKHRPVSDLFHSSRFRETVN